MHKHWLRWRKTNTELGWIQFYHYFLWIRWSKMVLGFKWAAIALLFGIWSDVRGELSCKDMNGKDVDWWVPKAVLQYRKFRFIALKMPQLDKSLNSVHPDIGSGTAFFYADANNQDFVISKKNINDPQSALGYTVTQAIQAHTATKKVKLPLLKAANLKLRIPCTCFIMINSHVSIAKGRRM